MTQKKKFYFSFPEADLTQGPIGKNLFLFAMPLFLGQLLQQFYNMADAWVVGNFASNEAFAAVSSAGNLIFLIIGFFNGIAIGGGVIISKYFGAQNWKMVKKAIHTNILLAIISSALATVLGIIFIPDILRLMKTPDSVMTESVVYFRIYFAGVFTVIFYNICMSVMRSLGDSLHPLYYLVLSSLLNVALDLLFVAGFRWGVAGASLATVLSQGVSAGLCLYQMTKAEEGKRLEWKALKWYPSVMKEVLLQGIPTGIQNSVISVGNIAIQTGINSFGAFAMSGVGAYSKVEGLAFLPITSISMAMPTFVSQNLGAGNIERAKKGSKIGVISGMILAEIVGVLIYILVPHFLKFFVDVPESISFGVIHAHITTLFYFLLAFSHCSAGVLRGCGKSVVPMITMLLCWCGVRIVYINVALKIFPVFRTIGCAYPLTWTLSTIVFTIFLLRMDWNQALMRK